MSGKGGSSKIPSVGQQLDASQAYGLLTQQANMVDQVTPWGTVTYTPTAYTETRRPWGHNEVSIEKTPSQWQATTTLTPQAQSAFDSYLGGLAGLGQMVQGQSGRVGDALSQPLSAAPTVADLPALYNGDWSSLPGLTGLSTEGLPELTDRGNMPTVDEGSRDSMLNSLMALQAPQVAQDRSALATKLANQGVSAGSQAYTSAMRDLEDQVARNRLSAVTTAADQARSDATFNLQSRNQADQYDLARRNLLFGERQAVSSDEQARRAQLFGEESQKQSLSDSRRANEWNLLAGQQAAEYSRRQQPLSELLSMLSSIGGGIQSPSAWGASVPQMAAPSAQVAVPQQQTNPWLSAGTGILGSLATAAAIY